MTTSPITSITDELLSELEEIASGNDEDAVDVHGVKVGHVRALLAERAELKRDAERLDFMLERYRKVVVELVPGRRHEVYVEEGFICEEQYPAVIHAGDWAGDSQEARMIKRKAIDQAMQEAKP